MMNDNQQIRESAEPANQPEEQEKPRKLLEMREDEKSRTHKKIRDRHLVPDPPEIHQDNVPHT